MCYKPRCLLLTLVCRKWVGAFKITILWSFIGVWWCFHWLSEGYSRYSSNCCKFQNLCFSSEVSFLFLYSPKFLTSVIERRVVCRLISHPFISVGINHPYLDCRIFFKSLWTVKVLFLQLFPLHSAPLQSTHFFTCSLLFPSQQKLA